MTQALDNIKGVAVIVDDILVLGTTVEEHNRRLQNALQRACELNLKLNKEKSKIQTSELSYVGDLLTCDGVKPDPQKVTAIKETQ
jgi:hypoxanthine-guanine phosphoribosyltransferase